MGRVRDVRGSLAEGVSVWQMEWRFGGLETGTIPGGELVRWGGGLKCSDRGV